MNFGECKNRIMQLAFSYSLAGTLIPDSYNNQADYLAMIPGLINTAATEIATFHKRIPATKPLSALTKTTTGDYDVYSLPSDCVTMMDGGLRLPVKAGRYHDYFRGVDNTIWVPKGTRNDFLLEYWRYPADVSSQTADSTELDNTKDTHECIPYYAASRILLYDDAYRSAELMNEYREKIGKLKEPVWLESGVIANVYQGETDY